ncbi:MAG TPA: hypothetical protein VK963_01995 [Candidatus Saccharimonadales bacterium]|nr:hypothetical protein [Candidatus Saccharimonadales bacterium]
MPAAIAVSGFGGAGKSTFAKQLGERIGAPVIGIDSFIKDRTLTDYSMWELMDFNRLKQEVLIPFQNSENPIHYGHFDWNKNAVSETFTVNHDGRIIVEGVGSTQAQS